MDKEEEESERMSTLLVLSLHCINYFNFFDCLKYMAQEAIFCYNFLMSPNSLRGIHRLCKWSTLTLGTLCLLMIGIAFLNPEGEALQGIIIRKNKAQMPWKIIESEQIRLGVVIPENTNVIFHLPVDMTEIDREVLLGQHGKDVRYWGYCLPGNYDPKIVERREGLPGLLFLSEKERAIREAAVPVHTAPTLSPFSFPTQEDFTLPETKKGIIRHQVETFNGGFMCYIMTEQSLSLGLDSDADRLNTELEREIGTNPETPDTEGDGLWDGVEYLTKTNPMLRDSDGDGLIDGVEDKNWNGRVNSGETDPRMWDSDRDGLCDGICRVKLGNGQQVFLGEDINLNGKVDDKETDPLKQDTDGDGTIDYVERLNCLKNKSAQGCS